jgi:murein L,D-transpeptidase YafK
VRTHWSIFCLLFSLFNFTAVYLAVLPEARANGNLDLDLNVTRLCPMSAQLAKQSRFKKVGSLDVSVDYILVDKKRKIMHLMEEGKVIRTYKVALGSKAGKKRKEGDRKSPEGLYSIGYKNSRSDFHLSLEISYPNAEDRDWARRNNVSAGGDIMIHGLPNEAWKKLFLGHPKNNWTRGCVAVSNKEIEEIYELVARETPVELCSDR